jgi:ADP-heptose:LPS heptosyltransferase/GT2 family glycosyltransferase
MVLEAGDVLGCDALLELATHCAMNPDCGFVYADEQRHDPVQERRAPFHKPAWSPELLLHLDYIGRPWAATRATLERAGLRLADLRTLAPYEAALRLTRHAGRVLHIDRVLAATSATTGAGIAMPALRGEMARRGQKAAISAGDAPGTWRVRRSGEFQGRVTIIIPTAGQGGLVKRAIDSVRATTPPALIDIVVLDNVPAGDRDTKAWLAQHADRVIPMPGAFNWSRFNNLAAAATDGAMLLFLNDDIEARSAGWLEAMLEHATRPEVGVTGARLLYPDGKVQHGGVFLAENSGRHAFRFAEAADAGPFGLTRVAREMSAVTGACMLVRRDVFNRLGGFNEAHDVINNDVDFCLRAGEAGMSVIFTPFAELMHHELASRALMEDRYDAARFTGDWRLAMLRGDPFHSRRLRDGTDYEEPDLEPVLPVFAGPRGPALDSVRRILAVKLDHIGDFLTAIPALRALKIRFPGAHVTVLAPKASALLARDEPSIDAVIDFTFFHARSAEGVRGVTDEEYAALALRLAPHGFDMAIDLRMHPETREVLRRSGAPFLVGYDRHGRFPWLDVSLEWEGDERLLAKPGHITERLLALVDAAALSCRPIEATAVKPPRGAATVPALARLPADFLAKRLVCIHPGVGNLMRRWPAAAFAGLIDLLAADEDMHAILVGGPDEQEIAREVQAAVAAQDRVISLAGALSLEELGATIQACALFVGNDSGPKHMAASLGVPTLGIHSAVVDAEEWAPLGTAAFALERRVVCGPCYLAFESECPRGRACLTGLKPRDALAACRRLLALR